MLLVVIRTPRTHQRNVDMNEQSQLTVLVVDHHQEPISGARVVRTGTDSHSQEQLTDADGRANFAEPAHELSDVTVTADGFGRDSRMVGGAFPGEPDGTELFILGPADWPSYFRGRIRVPFEPVIDAVGVFRQSGMVDLDHIDDEVAAIIGEPITEELTFADDDIAVVQLSNLHHDADSDGLTRDSSSLRVRALDTTVESINNRLDDEALVGAIVSLDEQGTSFLSDAVMVSLLSGDVDISALTERHGFVVDTALPALGSTYRLRAIGESSYALLERIEALAAEPGVRYAEPDLVSTMSYDAVTPNDFLFAQQWDHQLIDTPDAWQVLRDIDATRTFGDPTVTIAIVDNGVDAGHPSLAGNLSNGQPKVARLFDFSIMAANNDTLNTNAGLRDHGMACAAGAAGIADNAQGTAGVAGNCRVFGIRRGGTEVRYAQAYLWLAGLDADSSTPGFPAQLTQGVDVISSSFGPPDSSLVASQTMRDAFDAITNHGRDGRGTALFFSAGNASVRLDTDNRRPWATYNRCFGVTASTLADNGIDEVRAPYSNFGTQINFCAPSTDNSGPHNPPGSYGIYTGTHRATPEGTAVAGHAANSTSLSTAAAGGTTIIEVANVAGAVVGGSLLVGAPGNAASRGRTITGVNTTTRRVTINTGLGAGFAVGTPVVFAPREYRTDYGGTSYSTPMVAGVAALMYSANPQLTWRDVGQIIGDTADRIDPNNTNANGRWRDVDGRISTDPGYRGPNFSEFYGRGRVNAAAAVSRAAWTIDLVTNPLVFNDVPHGEQTYRAVRFNVKSLYASDFATVLQPGAPFSMPDGTTEHLNGSAVYADADEAYLWVAFTGGAPGTSASSSITVRHTQTGQQWTIPIQANSVAPTTTGIELILDRSGSMSAPSGVGSESRNQVLKYSAGILIDALHEGDGVGVVGFDHDASVVLAPVGPLGVPGLFDPDRDDVRTAVENFGVNVNGLTSVGDGLELGQVELSSQSGFDGRAAVVFTDGYENAHQFVSNVAGSITDRTFAVALGRSENIRPATLSQVTNGTGGYCMLTGDIDNDSRYKLAKYFLQVLAGAKNDEVVVDPEVTVHVGDTVEVPFLVTEADSVIDVLLLTQFPFLVDMTLITPDGEHIDPTFMAGLGGRNYTRVGEDIVYYRMTLPAPIGSGARAGQWRARFELPKDALERAKEYKHRISAHRLRELADQGLRGTMLVHASSQIKLAVEVQQKSYEPNSEVLLRARLTEYEVPVKHRSQVYAIVSDPAGATTQVWLSEVAHGVFEAPWRVGGQGAWSVLFHADGKSRRGTPFTREQVRSISVWNGGDSYEPKEGREPGVKGRQDPQPFEEALRELLRDPTLRIPVRERLIRSGFDVENLMTEDV